MTNVEIQDESEEGERRKSSSAPTGTRVFASFGERKVFKSRSRWEKKGGVLRIRRLVNDRRNAHW